MAKILICTGIYPPLVGGPAQYALEVETELRKRGNDVQVLTYNLERKLPTLIRHKLFFWRVVCALPRTDFILALDMFSVGWPSAWAAKIFRKKIIVRTGGDFLWEAYVERTGDLVLLRDFYQTTRARWSIKERAIFNITKRTLHRMSAVIFSTDWQRKIFEEAYGLDPSRNFVVENFYGTKLPPVEKKNRIFVGGTRPLRWKNIEMLRDAFFAARETVVDIDLDIRPAPYEPFLEKIREAYAVILVSLGDISPNMILDAIRSNTPFILTSETGIYERVKDVALFVDPKNPNDIREKILYLADPKNYKIQKEKVDKFNFTHSWSQICDEILEILEIAEKIPNVQAQQKK